MPAPRLITIAAALFLSACIGGGADRDAPAPGPMSVGPVTVTPLDAPPTAAAPAEASATASATASGAVPGVVGDEAALDGAKPGAAEAAAQAEAAAPRSDAQIACEATGGAWGRAGASAAMTCFRPTGDAGRTCRRESDCETLCLARSGSCAPVTPLFGCHPILQDDGREVSLCLD